MSPKFKHVLKPHASVLHDGLIISLLSELIVIANKDFVDAKPSIGRAVAERLRLSTSG
jgi:hypothetical protein